MQLKFDLMYYLNMSLSEINATPINDLEWLHSKLAEVKKDEFETEKNKLEVLASVMSNGKITTLETRSKE